MISLFITRFLILQILHFIFLFFIFTINYFSFLFFSLPSLTHTQDKVESLSSLEEELSLNENDESVDLDALDQDGGPLSPSTSSSSSSNGIIQSLANIDGVLSSLTVSAHEEES
jgi:hypothetical protein